MRKAGVNLTAASVINHLRKLHSCLHWTTSRNKASRQLEEPTEIQSQKKLNMPAAFGNCTDFQCLQARAPATVPVHRAFAAPDRPYITSVQKCQRNAENCSGTALSGAFTKAPVSIAMPGCPWLSGQILTAEPSGTGEYVGQVRVQKNHLTRQAGSVTLPNVR